VHNYVYCTYIIDKNACITILGVSDKMHCG
jgi:hypothetical protein